MSFVRIIKIICVIVCFSSLSYGDDGVLDTCTNKNSEYRSDRYPDKISLYIGGFFVGTQNTDIKFTKVGAGATLNLQDLFQLEKSNQLIRIAGAYRFTRSHSIAASWYSIKNTGYTSEDKAFEWLGVDIYAKGEMKTHFDTDIYKVNYVYSFYESMKVEMGLSMGLHLTTIDLGFEGEYITEVDSVYSKDASESIATIAPLPVLGYRLVYKIFPQWAVNFNADYFYFSSDSFSGGVTDFFISTDYRIWKHFSFGLGVNSTNLFFGSEGSRETSKFKINNSVTGLNFYTKFNF